MNTGVLYYKKFESNVQAMDYVEWAFSMLENGMSSPSLNLLVSLSEPLNLFEVEEFFYRALNELAILEPSYEERVASYVEQLLSTIVNDPSIAIDTAYVVYRIVRENNQGEDEARWYEISEMIDDFLYGDNLKMITRDTLTNVIVLEARQQLKTLFEMKN